MTVTEFEDLIVAEARKAGFHPNALAMNRVAADLIGYDVNEDGVIVITGKGVIHPKDYLRSLIAKMPDCFVPIDTPPTATGNLTEQYRLEIAENRNALPDDWHAIRSRVTGLTALMMDERAGESNQ